MLTPTCIVGRSLPPQLRVPGVVPRVLGMVRRVLGYPTAVSTSMGSSEEVLSSAETKLLKSQPCKAWG